MHQVGDVLPDGREIVGVDETLRRYSPEGNVEATGVEYQFTKPGIIDHEGNLSVRRFQQWQEV